MFKVLAGDLAPWFYARETRRARFSFSSTGGGYRVLTFIASSQHPFERQLLTGLYSLPDLFHDNDSVLFIVTADPDDDQPGRLVLRSPGIKAFFDTDRSIADLFGVSYQIGRPVSYLLSPRLQVLGIVLAGGAGQQADTISGFLRQQPSIEQIGRIFGDAPVLVIPHVFEHSLCRELIDYYKRVGGSSSGFMVEEGGRSVAKLERRLKVRRDAVIDDAALTAAIWERFGRRVMPAVQRAYQFEAHHLERYIVACYDAEEGGHFAAHRDNTTPGTKHRRFAVTVNLNAGEYEGGELWFPEFGTRKYAPPSGAALVFSCSLLHRALPVLRGVLSSISPRRSC
jgi:predicted 2-oxoglutarate/Fe(II)-dependent dioxygenase YbiX